MLFPDGNSEQEIRIFFAWTLYRGEPHPELERWYYENSSDIDERAPRVRRAPDGQLLHFRDVYTEEEPKNFPACHALRTRGRGGDGIEGPHGARITWLIHDSVNGAGWSSAQLDIIRALLPHIRQTVHVQQSLAGGQALAATMQGLLGATVLVLLVDPTQRITVDPSVAAEALGLTPMESQAAALMAQDIAVPEIAARMDRQISTIRFHVKSMYRKVGLTRQHELTRLVQSLARKDTEDGS